MSGVSGGFREHLARVIIPALVLEWLHTRARAAMERDDLHHRSGPARPYALPRTLIVQSRLYGAAFRLLFDRNAEHLCEFRRERQQARPRLGSAEVLGGQIHFRSIGKLKRDFTFVCFATARRVDPDRTNRSGGAQSLSATADAAPGHDTD